MDVVSKIRQPTMVKLLIFELFQYLEIVSVTLLGNRKQYPLIFLYLKMSHKWRSGHYRIIVTNV